MHFSNILSCGIVPFLISPLASLAMINIDHEVVVEDPGWTEEFWANPTGDVVLKTLVWRITSPGGEFQNPPVTFFDSDDNVHNSWTPLSLLPEYASTHFVATGTPTMLTLYHYTHFAGQADEWTAENPLLTDFIWFDADDQLNLSGRAIYNGTFWSFENYSDWFAGQGDLADGNWLPDYSEISAMIPEPAGGAALFIGAVAVLLTTRRRNHGIVRSESTGDHHTGT